MPYRFFVFPIHTSFSLGKSTAFFLPVNYGARTPSYIKGIRRDRGRLPFRETIGKLFASFITLATFGNGGVVGPVGRVNAGIMSRIFSFRRQHVLFPNDVRTAAMCGVAATVGAVFHSSVGGGIFAVEIIQKKEMRYSDLFPAILSSASAVFISRSLGWESVYFFPAVERSLGLPNVLWLFVFSLGVGVLGAGYTSFYSLVTRLIGRDTMKHMLLKALSGTAIAALAVYFFVPELMGTSTAVFSGVMHPAGELLSNWEGSPVPLFLLLLFFALLKGAANCITVGSGMSAGFTGPAVIMGILAGAAFANAVGLDPGSGDYYAFLAAGFAGILAGSMNIPLAAAVIAIETFGLAVSFPAGLAAVIGFQVNRHHTIYHFAFRQYEKVSREIRSNTAW